MMTQEQIKKVRMSWRKLMGVDPAIIGDLFYTKLFTDQPRLRKLFPEDMTQQNKKLIDMLTSIITSLANPDYLLNDVKTMGKRHIGYGVQPEHYKMVGQALLWTLQEGLQNDWTQEVEEAWISCYDVLSQTMIEAG